MLAMLKAVGVRAFSTYRYTRMKSSTVPMRPHRMMALSDFSSALPSFSTFTPGSMAAISRATPAPPFAPKSAR